ncbi:MAG: GDSL-type esterase/lipase family protein [Lachnospiraceae bacterium]
MKKIVSIIGIISILAAQSEYITYAQEERPEPQDYQEQSKILEDETLTEFPNIEPEDLSDGITEEIQESPVENTTPPLTDKKKKPEQEVLDYSALGDSIAKGYTCDQSEMKSYPKLISDRVKNEEQEKVNLVLTAKVGLATDKLNQGPLSNKEVLSKIQDAELITLTMGSNDLMNEFKRLCKEILNHEDDYRSINDAIQVLKHQVLKHPTLVFKVIRAIGDWNYAAFEDNWKETMEILDDHRKPNSKIVVTNIYNPVTALKLPNFVESVVDKVIGEMNTIIAKNAKKYDYEVVELFDTEITEYVQADGLHPNPHGQRLIADAVYEKWKLSLGEEITPKEGDQQVAALGAAKYNPGNEFETIVIMSLLFILSLISNSIGKRRRHKR